MHNLAIHLTHTAIAIANNSSAQTPRSHVVATTALELMHRTQCSKHTAALAAAKALAEIESIGGVFINPIECTSYGIAINVSGTEHFIGTRQLIEMLASYQKQIDQDQQPFGKHQQAKAPTHTTH